MYVEQILENKGKEVVTVHGDLNLLDAARMLVEQSIGSLVIIGPQGQLTGIIAERDIVHALTAKGADALTSRIEEFATRPPEITLDTRLDAVMRIMTDQRFRHLAVVEDHKLRGIISIGDVVKHKIEETEEEAKALKDYIAA